MNTKKRQRQITVEDLIQGIQDWFLSDDEEHGDRIDPIIKPGQYIQTVDSFLGFCRFQIACEENHGLIRSQTRFHTQLGCCFACIEEMTDDEYDMHIVNEGEPYPKNKYSWEYKKTVNKKELPKN